MIQVSFLKQSKPKPSSSVLEWLKNQPIETLFISSISFYERTRGVYKLHPSKKRQLLSNWLINHIPDQFCGRILDFDEKSALTLGQWQGELDRKGCPLPLADGQIAAMAARYNLKLVTRNIKHIKELPIECLNPFNI